MQKMKFRDLTSLAFSIQDQISKIIFNPSYAESFRENV